MVWISQVEYNARMGPGTTAVRKLPFEVNSAVKAQSTVWQDINIQSLVVGGCIQDTNVTSLHKIVSHNNVLLIRSHFDVMRSNCGLLLVGVVETLNIVKVANIERSDMVGGCKGKVCKLAILSNIGAGN
jgi:hypothetical protein